MTDAISLRSQAYQKIRQRIVEGTYPRGSKISDFTLSRELGVSRAPIRESLNQLVSEGFLEQKPGLGTFIRTPIREEIVDLYQLREWIEESALKIAIERLKKTEIRQLENSCQDIRKLAKELAKTKTTLTPGKSFKCLNEADALFHMTFLRASGNQFATEILRDYRVLEQLWSFYLEPHDAKKLHSICDEHEAILTGLKSRNLDQSISALHIHLDSAKQASLDMYDEQHTSTATDGSLLT